jgi:hypothetical protein
MKKAEVLEQSATICAILATMETMSAVTSGFGRSARGWITVRGQLELSCSVKTPQTLITGSHHRRSVHG